MADNKSFTPSGKGNNGEKGLGKPGKGGSGYGQNQGKARYSRKRITKMYGGGK